jgi:hypothetical protein
VIEPDLALALSSPCPLTPRSTPLRDLRRNVVPPVSLVVIAVGLIDAAVAGRLAAGGSRRCRGALGHRRAADAAAAAAVLGRLPRRGDTRAWRAFEHAALVVYRIAVE